MENQLGWCSISVIPDDIIADILLRLSMKDVVRFRCVCKIWRDLTSTTDFMDILIKKTDIKNIISDDDFKIPSCYIHILLGFDLPVMMETFKNKDFSLLRKYCFQIIDSSSIENLSFEEALKHELVGTCVFYLLSKECSPVIKVGLASALLLILSIFPKTTNMPIAKLGEGVVNARRKMYIDQACIDALVAHALCWGDEEIIRQVCAAIYFVVAYHVTDTIGTSIQIELVKLVSSFPSGPYINCFAIPLLKSIDKINFEIEDGFMREKLVQAMLSDRKWWFNIVRNYDEDAELQGYNILQVITRGKYDDGLWEPLLHEIIPDILENDVVSRGFYNFYHISLVGSAAMIISNIINGASSPDKIRRLALDTDCLRALVAFLDLLDEVDTSVCMEAIEKILKLDDDESEDNIFAKMIGKHRYLHVYGSCGEENTKRVKGWYLLYNDAPNSKSILLKYAPRNWLPEKLEFEDIERLMEEEEEEECKGIPPPSNV